MGHIGRTAEYRRAAVRLGELLRDLRLGAELTIDELAAKVDEPVAFIKRIERGSYVVDPFELEELCAAYGVDFIETVRSIDSALDEVRQQLPGRNPKRPRDSEKPQHGRAPATKLNPHELSPTDPGRVGHLLRGHSTTLAFVPNARTEQLQPRVDLLAINHDKNRERQELGHDPWDKFGGSSDR